MTLRPHEAVYRFVPVEGPSYPTDEMCANPFCHQPAVDPHHCWSSGEVGKQSDWMLDTEMGTLVPNKIGVCRACHDDVHGLPFKGHTARVMYLEDERALYWIDLPSQEGAPIESLSPGSVVERADWLRAQGRDEEADLLMETVQ